MGLFCLVEQGRTIDYKSIALLDKKIPQKIGAPAGD